VAAIPASAAATTVTAQVEDDVVAARPVEGNVTVTGAPSGARVWMVLHWGTSGCPALNTFSPTTTVAPGPDFTLPFKLEETDSYSFHFTGPWLLCVSVATADNYGRAVEIVASTAPLLMARAPRGRLAVVAARWNARRHRLRFSLRGRSEARGTVYRFLLPGRAACPRKRPPLLQTPADLGSVGPPEDAAGRFSYTRTVTWRREVPPPGLYRVCAYLLSDAATGPTRGSQIQISRASRLVRVSR
jgi:hypothetical protein